MEKAPNGGVVFEAFHSLESAGIRYREPLPETGFTTIARWATFVAAAVVDETIG
ncbi:hypothetical protein [Rhizobium sp. BK251]|uniref:hypothetical protein n=1 Tax=Rhizobium sp. BK251 TaxID=2512125 RepID=UPI0014044F11|nr:hypothetical protein [Rhizobium sp. BK251]